MPNYLHSSNRRVQNWLDSVHYFSPTSDEEKSSLVSNYTSNKSSITKNSSNLKNQSTRSRKSSLSSSNDSSSSSTKRTSRRAYLRKPRILYATRRLRRSNLKKKNSDQSSSYFSGNTTDESNLFSNSSVFMNENSTYSNKKLPAEIKADDLEFDKQKDNHSDIENLSNCSYYSNNNQHSFGILDFEQWDNNLKLNDEIEFKVKMYAFDLKDIKIKIKDNNLIVIGKQSIEEDDGYYKREFCKKFNLPMDVDRKNIKYDFDKNDHLVITVPKKIYSIH